MSARNRGKPSGAKSAGIVSERGRKLTLLACLTLVLTACGLFSCGAEVETPDPQVGTDTQPVVQAFTMSFQLPSGVELHTMAASAKTSLNARDRAKIEGPMGTSAGPLIVANDAKVRALTAKGNITIGDRTVVTGNVRASGSVTRSPSATVNGTVQANVNLGALKTIQWSFQADNVSSGDVLLEPDQKRDLLPGSYGTLNVKSRAEVTLHTGVYRFGRIIVEPQGKLLIDSVSGPVQAYFTQGLTYRGAIETARFGLPQLLLGHMGTETVFIEAPFTGALIAPNAELRFQAATPQGHRAVIHGKSVIMEPDTLVRVIPFNWGGVDPRLQPPQDPARPVHTAPRSPADDPVSVDGNGGGEPTSTSDSPTPVGFNLPTSYPVAGGEICNSTVTFRYRLGTGPLVSCTYRGGSTTATPTTEEELNRGRTLHFQSCTNGQPASAQRQATHFELAVTPCPGFAVTVNSPVINDKACSEQMELLTIEQTRQMRLSFNWSNQQKVQPKNPDGSPALYYAWVLVKDKEESLALRKLFIHVLKRPLLKDELERFAGKCGSITNPGDGIGTFVPVVIPGETYNSLIDIRNPQLHPDVDGSRDIFDAVIIRQLPENLRNQNGSIRLDHLVNSGFEFLHYESKPRPNFRDMELDGVSKVLFSALEICAEIAVETTEFVTNRLGDLSKLFLGSVNVQMNLHATNADPNFNSDPNSPGPIAVRGWGGFAGQPLAAPGLQVTIIQPFMSFLPIPATSMGNTDMTGFVSIDAIESPTAAGWCIEMENDAAVITDFLIASEFCDFRGFNELQHPFWNMNVNKGPLVWHIADTKLFGMYQASDVFEWDKAVAHFEPKRARIVSGFFADTFTTKNNGVSRLFTPCLNFGNLLSDALLVESIAAGQLANIVPGAVVSAVIPVMQQVLGNTDIVMGLNSSLRTNREVMSHEYGHYTLCALLTEENEFADDYIIISALQDDQSKSPRYMNEAFADFITGQVVGAADYSWLPNSKSDATGTAQYCQGLTGGGPCWDTNLRPAVNPADKFDTLGIRRVATLLMDAFDGHLSRGGNLPGNGDIWQLSDPGEPNSVLVYSASNYLSTDSALERVALPGQALLEFAKELGDDLPPMESAHVGEALLNDARIYRSVNHAMMVAPYNYNWCDRCRVLALHSTTLDPPPPATPLPDSVPKSIQHCLTDPFIATALQGPPPEPAGNFNYTTCELCPPGQLANGAGGCSQCPADVILDGATVAIPSTHTFDPTSVQAPNDVCPQLFIVQVNNPQAAFPRGGTGITGRVDPVMPPLPATLDALVAACERPFQLTTSRQTSADFVLDPAIVTTGSLPCSAAPGPCVAACEDTPLRRFTAGELPSSGAVRFSTPATDPNNRLTVVFNGPGEG